MIEDAGTNCYTRCRTTIGLNAPSVTIYYQEDKVVNYMYPPT